MATPVGTRDRTLLPPSQQRLAGSWEVLRALVRKELKIKYKRSILGFLWSFITPLALTGIYLFVFTYVYEVAEDDFALFLLSGLLPWNFLNLSILGATESLVRNAATIRRVPFTRELVPISVIATNLITFVTGLGILTIAVLISGRPVHTQLHWLFIGVVLQTALAVGAGAALSVWNVYMRDVAQLIGIFMTILFFATPIVYDLDRVPERFLPVILVNPLSSIMEIYRAALLRGVAPPLHLVGLAAVQSLAVLGCGMLIFRRSSPRLPKEL